MKERVASINLFYELARVPGAATARGVLYEVNALAKISEGGEFATRDLATGAETRTVFPRMEMRTFSDGADLALGEASVWVPLLYTNPGFDAIVPGVGFLQCTIAETHAIKAAGVALMQQLAEVQPQSLYFVVPSSRYAGFGKQQIRGARGVAQHCMCVDI